MARLLIGAVVLIAFLGALVLPTADALVAVNNDYDVQVGVNGSLIITVNPNTPIDVIATIVAGLKAGDILQFAAGVYLNVGLDLTGLLGSADAWIIIRGIPCGTEYPILKIDTDVVLSANVLLGLGSSFIKLEGLVLSQVGSGLVNGIQFLADASNIVLTDLQLLGINGIGIDLSDVNDIVNVLIQHNILANIGLLQVAENLGVGILVGGLLKPVENVLNIQIIDNVLHDLFGNVGSAIQVLLGVVAPQILDNVIFNAPLGLGLGLDLRPALVVVTGIANDLLSNLPLVGRNLIFGSSGLNLGLGLTVALQIGAGTQCVNNIVVNADIGLDLVLGGDLTVFLNTLIAHNTIFNVTTCALRILDGLVSDTLRIVNNVLAVGLGLVGVVLQLVEGILGSVALILNNVVQGLLGVDLTGDLSGLLITAEDLLGGVVGSVDNILDNVVDGVLGGTLNGVLGNVGGLLGGLLGGLNLGGSVSGSGGLNLGGILNLGGSGGLNLGGILGKRAQVPMPAVRRSSVIAPKRGAATGPFAFISTTIDNLFQDVENGVLLPVGPLLNQVVGDVNLVVDQVGRVVDLLLKDVLEIVNSLVGDLQSLLIQLGNPLGLADVLGTVKNLLDNLISTLVGTVDELITDVEDVLTNVGGILNGVVGDVSGLLGSVNGVLDGLLGDNGLLGGLLGNNGLLGGLLGGNGGLLGGLLGNRQDATATATATGGLGLNLGGLLGGLLGGNVGVDGSVDVNAGLDLNGLLSGLLGGNGLLGGLLNLGGDGTGVLDLALGNVLGSVLGDLNGVLGGVLGAVDPLLNGILGNVNSLLNNLLTGLNLDGLLSGLLADVNGLLAQVLALVNALLRALLGGVVGNLNPLLGGLVGDLVNILDGVLGGLLNGNLSLTADINIALNLVLADLGKLLNAVLSDVDLLLADILGLVDFNGVLRCGRFSIGALQAGLGLDFKIILGFKSGVIVEVPCTHPTSAPACPARRASISSSN